MSKYKVSAKTEYKPKRRLAKLKRSISHPKRSSWTSFQISKPKATKLAVNVMDLAGFLGRYLSGRKEVSVNAQQHPGFATSVSFKSIRGRRVQHYYIKIPNWDDYKINMDDFNKYRIYRHGVYHEAMHVKFTPPDLIAEYGKDSPSIYREVMNVIEDRRIEDLGQEEWPGYLPERLFVQAYAYTVRPDVSKLYDPSFPDNYVGNQRAVFEAFLQRMLIGKIKGGDALPQRIRDKIEKVAKRIENSLKRLKKHKDDFEEVEKTVTRLTEYAVKTLNLYPSFNVTPQNQGSYGHWEDTFAPENAKPKSSVEQGMEQFFEEKEKEAVESPAGKEVKKKNPNVITKEDIEQAKHGSADVQTEFSKAMAKPDLPEELEFGWARAVSVSPPTPFRDLGFISKMKNALKDWRIGYKEFYTKGGARLSIPAYIRTKGELPFKKRIKMSAKGQKMLVIADLSGSIKGMEHEYKTSIISTMEVLDSIGVKTALFTFAEDPSLGEGFFIVKTFEEPRWTSTHSSKLAALEAGYSCTPTAAVYKYLEPYIKKHQPQITVTVTDGFPDRPLNTTYWVKQLKRYTKMVAYGIALDDRLRQEMEEAFKQFKYHKTAIVRNVYELPPKLVKLLAPY